MNLKSIFAKLQKGEEITTEEQEAIDKFGEITLIEHEQGDITEIATAIINAREEKRG